MVKDERSTNEASQWLSGGGGRERERGWVQSHKERERGVASEGGGERVC